MKLARTHWLLIGLLIWTPLTIGNDAGPKDQRPRASLEVHGEPEQPAGAPIILLLTAKNSGKVPIIYWCGGPGEYPDASDYSTQVKRAAGPFNSQPYPRIRANASPG